MRHGHAEALMPMIDRVVRAAGIEPGRLDIVAAATGPGGFTGIRAGLAAAQGIALAAGARLIGVTSFAAVAAATRLRGADNGPETSPDIPQKAISQGAIPREAGASEPALLVALDSRRDDLYVQLFAADRATPLAEPAALPPERLAAHIAGLIGDAPLLIAGDRAELAADALTRSRLASDRSTPDRLVHLLPDSAPDARGVAAAALSALNAGREDAPVRPLYLRPPDVTLAKVGAKAGPKAGRPGAGVGR